MADETFEIGLKVTGEDKAARAFENLKLRQMEAAAEATKLAAELRKLQQSGTASATEIEKTSRALIRAKQSASEYGAQARSVQAAVTAATRAAQQNTAATVQQGTSVTALGGKVGQTASAFGNLGSVLGSVNPSLGHMGSVIGSVGSAVTGATGAMGPLGIAIAAVGTAVAVGMAVLDHYEQQTRAIGEAAVESRRSIEALANTIAGRANDERLFEGSGTADEQREFADERRRLAEAARTQIEPQLARLDAEIAPLEREMAARQARIERLQAEGRATGTAIVENGESRRLAVLQAQRSRAANQLADYERTAEAARIAEQLAAGRAANAALNAPRTDGPAPTSPTGASTAAARERELATIEDAEAAARMRTKAAENEAALFQEGLLEARVNAVADAYAQEVRLARDAQDEIFNAEMEKNAAREEERKRADREREDAEKQKAEAVLAHQREIGAITSGMWDSIGGTVKDAAGDMFKFLISGAEGGTDAFLNLLDSFLEATSIEYTIKALGEGANAVAAFARQDHAAGAQHLVAAGMAAAVAAATGLASAAISVPSAGGGGEPAQVGAGAGGAGQGGPTNVTIQLYAPQAVFTEAERAELLARGAREAERIRPGSARV